MKEEKKEPWVIPYSEVLKRQYPSDSAPAGSASGEKATMPAASLAGSVSGGSPDGVAAPYIAPSLFSDYDGIEIPEVKLNLTDINAARAKEEMDRIATRLAEPPAASAPDGSASGEKAPVPEGSPSGVNYWYVLLAILAFIGNVIFFLPLCILGLFGLSKHPFLGYFMFRDMFRK